MLYKKEQHLWCLVLYLWENQWHLWPIIRCKGMCFNCIKKNHTDHSIFLLPPRFSLPNLVTSQFPNTSQLTPIHHTTTSIWLGEAWSQTWSNTLRGKTFLLSCAYMSSDTPTIGEYHRDLVHWLLDTDGSGTVWIWNSFSSTFPVTLHQNHIQ